MIAYRLAIKEGNKLGSQGTSHPAKIGVSARFLNFFACALRAKGPEES